MYSFMYTAATLLPNDPHPVTRDRSPFLVVGLHLYIRRTLKLGIHRMVHDLGNLSSASPTQP
jgi:hypothetical protein